MAYPYDPNATNQALNKLGSPYQLPVQNAPMAEASPTAPSVTVQTASPASPATPTAPAAAPTNDPGAPKPDGSAPATNGSGTQAAEQMAQTLSGLDTEYATKKQNAGMQKVGALIGTVLSAYTGNAAGVAGGVSAMKTAGK